MNDNLISLYINKNRYTDDIVHLTVEKLFLTQNNLDKLYRIIYRELFLPNNSVLFKDTKLKVDVLANEWANSGGLSKFVDVNSLYDVNEQLDYINNIFISYCRFKFANSNLIEHEIENNHKPNKIFLLASDYEKIGFNNYKSNYTNNMQFSKNYHKIPYYEKSLYSKKYDISDNGSFRERKLVNDNSKKYNNNELFNNVNYLR